MSDFYSSGRPDPAPPGSPTTEVPVDPGAKKDTWFTRPVKIGPARVPVLALLLLVLVIAGVVFWIAVARDTTSGAGKVDSLIVEGIQKQTAGDLAGAAESYQKAIDADPNNAKAHYDLGTVYQSQGNGASAITEFETAGRLDPTMTDAFYNLGILYTPSDKTKAEQYYRQAITADPNNARAHLNLGYLLKDMGRAQEGDAEIATSKQLQEGSSTTVAGASAPAVSTPTSTSTTAR